MRKLLFALPCLFALAACGSDSPKAGCLGSSTQCGDTCVDTAHDQLNCGGCGIACGARQVCSDGACTDTQACLAGSTQCGATCANLASDQNNCGACGNGCAPGQVCSSGACAATCAAPTTVCGSTCADLTWDRANCGACGSGCGPAYTCVNSACALEAWEPLDDLPDYVFGFSTNVPDDASIFYLLFDNGRLRRVDAGQTLVDLADAPTVPTAPDEFNSLALVGGKLYTTNDTSLLAYSIADNTWTTPIPTLALATPSGRQIAADDNGFLYFVGHDTIGAKYQLTKVDTSSFTETHYDLPIGLGDDEPRTVYDHASRRVYVADYSDTDGLFYAFDPATNTFSTALATFAPSTGYNDGFCTDSRGHIFATNGNATTSHEMWMYTVSTNTWSDFPPLPFDVSSGGSCVVAGGWFYFSSSTSRQFARYPIGR